MQDRDGHRYRTVVANGLEWTVDNLRTVHYQNGDPILNALGDDDYLMAGKNKQGAWCHMNNDAALDASYGKIYNWFAVHDPRGLAPEVEGWRIPTEEDWSSLETYFSAQMAQGEDQWERLKETFHLQYSGSRGINGAFGGFGKSGYWWKYMPLTEAAEQSWGRRILLSGEGFEPIDGFQRFGFAVRLVRTLE